MKRSPRRPLNNGNEGCRALLMSKRSELLPRRAVKFDTLAQAGQLPEDDQVTVLHDEFIALKLSNLERKTLAAIDTALKRLDAGEYGICMECGVQISAKRLDAIPWAERCIRCAEHVGTGPDSTELSCRAA
jgi:DnaK suppressor protein